MITSLCDYYYNICGGHSVEEREEKDILYKLKLDRLKRSEFKKILYTQLLHYGYQGSYHDGFFEAANDVAEQRSKWYKYCSEWVCKMYPNL